MVSSQKPREKSPETRVQTTKSSVKIPERGAQKRELRQESLEMESPADAKRTKPAKGDGTRHIVATMRYGRKANACCIDFEFLIRTRDKGAHAFGGNAGVKPCF